MRSRRLLKRLEFLFELPKKLEVAVSEGRHEDAVALYESADAVLSSHGHVASLRDIHDDARRIVTSLKGDLQIFDDTLAASGNLAARVRLLTKVGDAQDASKARAAAADCADRYLCGVLDDALRNDDASLSLERRVSMLSDKFCGPRDAVRGQLDGVVELPSGPYGQIRGPGQKNGRNCFRLWRRRPRVKSCGRRRPGARFRGSGGRRGEGARRFRAGARERLDQGPGRPRRFYRIGRRPALRSAPNNADVALRRAARSLRERAAPLEPFLSKDDSVSTRTAKSEAWLRSIIEARGGLQPSTIVALAALCRLRGDDVLSNDLLERHVAVVGEDLDQKAQDAIATISVNDGPASYIDACVSIVAAASKRVDAALRFKNHVADIQLSDDAVDRRARSLRTPRASGAAARSGVEMDVEKLFAKEENHVANVKDDVTTGVGLAAALLSRFASALAASVRTRSLTRATSTRSSSGTAGGSTPCCRGMCATIDCGASSGASWSFWRRRRSG